MTKIKETIQPHQTVTVRLTGYGGHVLVEHASHPDRPPKPGSPLPMEVTMTLWELAMVFGPHIKTSAKSCFADVEFMRNMSMGERDINRVNREAHRVERALESLLAILGASNAERWSSCKPNMVPDGEGYWWLNDAVVEVIRADDGGLAYRKRNGHKAFVHDVIYDAWRGPACIDPRIKKHLLDNDIPF